MAIQIDNINASIIRILVLAQVTIALTRITGALTVVVVVMVPLLGTGRKIAQHLMHSVTNVKDGDILLKFVRRYVKNPRT